jgi:hypothetical protein
VAIDESLRRQIAEHLKRTWRSPICHLCGCDVWELHGYVTLVLTDSPATATGADGLPTVAVVCQRCGNTILINLVVARALPPL